MKQSTWRFHGGIHERLLLFVASPRWRPDLANFTLRLLPQCEAIVTVDSDFICVDPDTGGQVLPNAGIAKTPREVLFGEPLTPTPVTAFTAATDLTPRQVRAALGDVAGVVWVSDRGDVEVRAGE